MVTFQPSVHKQGSKRGCVWLLSQPGPGVKATNTVVGGGGGRGGENSELYYSRIEILGSCLFLQSVLAYLHANT